MQCGLDYYYSIRTGQCQVFKCNRGRCDDPECNKAFAKRRIAIASELVREYGLSRFFTLTLDRSYPIDSAWNMISHWWSLLRHRLKRYCKKLGYDLKFIAVLECHKDGYPHVHGFWNVYIPTRLLSSMWQDCSGGKMVWLEAVTDEDKAVDYVSKQLDAAKYIGKDQVANASKRIKRRKRTMWRSKGLNTEFERRKKALDNEAGDKYNEWILVTESELHRIQRSQSNGEAKQGGQDMEGTLSTLPEEGTDNGVQIMEAQERETVSNKEACHVTRTTCQDQCRSAPTKGHIDDGKTTIQQTDTSRLQHRKERVPSDTATEATGSGFGDRDERCDDSSR